ncbi:hypothetical protein [Rhodococcus erythropolis]|uniref:hypothetical protein n=1 Tax=Rhodococcus erythropolis TaxID=1833 RepID=UPI000F73D551|nr:hypothetical protein [Rhodococcus erythropolis]
MPLIEWTRLPGEAVEDAVAMLLCGENFDATQVRPGKGDGGIDVFVPDAADWSRRDVYQVKRYAENLTNSQKRKIAGSLREAIKTAEKEKWTISSWWLVLPLNPTPGNLAWFTELMKDLPFEAHWVGLNRVEFLAAKYPQVIDYYLRDGRERLQEQTDRLASIVAGRNERKSGEPLQPFDTIGDLRDIYKAMNEYDPHYRYEISMTSESPTQEDMPKSPGLVGVASYGSSDDGWVNVSIFARSLAATIKRPITGEFQLHVPDDAPYRQEFQKFIDYGTPVSLPPGSAKVKLDLPGGLGGDQFDAAVSLGPLDEVTANFDDREMIFAMLSPERESLAEIELRLDEVTVGQAGGRRTVWKDKPGFIAIEILAKDYPNLTANVSITVNVAGRKPGEIVNSLEFLANMHGDNMIGLAQTFGPRKFTVGTINEERERDLDFISWAKIARALISIQEHTVTRLLFPQAYTGAQVREIIEAARILSGTPISVTWQPFRVDRDPNITSDWFKFNLEDEVDLRVIRNIEIEIDDVSHVVGKQATLMRAVVAEISDETVRFKPAESDIHASIVRFDGDAEDGRVQVRSNPKQAKTDV